MFFLVIDYVLYLITYHVFLHVSYFVLDIEYIDLYFFVIYIVLYLAFSFVTYYIFLHDIFRNICFVVICRVYIFDLCIVFFLAYFVVFFRNIIHYFSFFTRTYSIFITRFL